MTITPISRSDKNTAVRLMRSGEMTAAEVAMMLGTSRQAVRYWAVTAGVDLGEAREKYLRATWKKAAWR